MEIRPIENATLGASVEGIDLRSLGDDTFNVIEAAWHEYAVLLFPGQHLNNREHLDFSRRFGRLERGLKRSDTPSADPISNVKPDGTIASPSSLQVRFNIGNGGWHTDSSYKRVGAKASLLAAHRVPATGGETEWADMRAGYDELSNDTKAWLEDKVAVHSYRYSHAWHGGLELLSAEELEDLPPVEHPVVRTHPATGRKNLFVGRHASHIIGQSEAESRKLLRDLTEDAAQPPRTWKHRWQPGDLVIWDNRCVLHRGHEFPHQEPRVMVRTTVAGDAPDNEWAA